MIWVTWRQYRAQFLIAVGLLVVLGVLVLITGTDAHDSLGTLGASCQRQFRDCAQDGDHTPLKGIFGPLLLAIPALLGMFWGAPLVAREYETGTYRLAFTQSISRRHWLTVKIVLIGLTAVVIAGLASWLITWWYAPFDAANLNRMSPGVFTERGIVAIGYTVCAVALGVGAGAAIRRTLPAMAATLVGYAALRGIFTLVRSSLLPVSHAVLPAGGLYSLANIPGAWTISIRAGADRNITQAQYHRLMVHSCHILGQLHCRTFPTLHNPLPMRYVTYQPAGHFWPMQFLEMGVFTLVGLGIAAITIRVFTPRAQPRTDTPPVRSLSLSSPDHPEIDPVSRDCA